MLCAELACQQLDRQDGVEGKIAWPLKDLTLENLAQVLAIAGVFTLNTRLRDQIPGRVIHAVGNPLMLFTILKSWERSRPFVQAWLEILKLDPKLQHQWDLHVWDEIDELGSQSKVEKDDQTAKSSLDGSPPVEDCDRKVEPVDPQDREDFFDFDFDATETPDDQRPEFSGEEIEGLVNAVGK